MTSKSSYILVGAFVLLLAAGFIWGVLWISAGGPPQRFEHYLVYMTESVSGLNVDAPLKFRGVDVGKVEQIEIDPRNPERIRLLLQVRQGLPITVDTVATLEYQGLTGLANVNLIGGKADSAALGQTPGEEYPVIQTRPSIFSSLNTTLTDVLPNLAQTVASVNALLNEDNRANVALSIENIATMTGRFAQQSDQLEAVIDHLLTTLENTSVASADLPQLMRQFSAGAEAISGMAGQIQKLAESLDSTSARLGQTVDASSNSVVDFSRNTLPEIGQMVYELRQAAENLRRVSESLAQDPSVLLYGRSPPQPGPGE